MNVEGLVKALHLEDYGAIMQLLFHAYLCRAAEVAFLKM